MNKNYIFNLSSKIDDLLDKIELMELDEYRELENSIINLSKSCSNFCGNLEGCSPEEL